MTYRESQTSTTADFQAWQAETREAVLSDVIDADEPRWFDMPGSVYAAYEDAVMAEMY